ncbi:MAG: porin [Agarilytica sp.]
MNTTKKLLASAVAASIAAAVVPAHADIELGEGLTVTGFVDMSFVHSDVDVDGAETSQDFSIDQVETDFLYAGKDGISAQVDIEYSLEEGTDENEENTSTFVEQAFITKDFGSGFSVKGGRFLSYSGWETEEPTGLFQYSGAGYGGLFYGGYQQGVSAYYDTDVVDVMFSVVNDAFDPNESDNENMGIEAGVAVTPVEGLTAKLFYITNDDNDLINAWASYEVSGWTLAVELNSAEYADESEATGSLLMANYASGDFGITLRVHEWSVDDAAGDTAEESSGITIAPSYVVTDNLLVVAEYRMDTIDADGEGAGDEVDVTTIAFEALFTF